MNDQKSYYETMYILRPDIAEDEVTNHIDKYNKLLKEFGGTILDSQMTVSYTHLTLPTNREV